MSVTDAKVHPNAKHALVPVVVNITTALSQTATKAIGLIPGFKFEVAKVQVWASGVTATISTDVNIDGTSVLTGAVTPVAGTATNGTLVAARTSRRGSATAQLNVVYTTNGTGAAVNLKVTVWLRPYPLNGEV